MHLRALLIAISSRGRLNAHPKMCIVRCQRARHFFVRQKIFSNLKLTKMVRSFLLLPKIYYGVTDT